MDPGATEVFTHGFEARPFSTAFRARMAAASITEGLEVLVHEVMDAMLTAPWSSTNSRPSLMLTLTGRDGRPFADAAAECLSVEVMAGTSEAGNDSSSASSSAG